ncbi:hypothetical protein ABTJ52_21610, partial [Acinetobacter baumannii]
MGGRSGQWEVDCTATSENRPGTVGAFVPGHLTAAQQSPGRMRKNCAWHRTGPPARLASLTLTLQEPA